MHALVYWQVAAWPRSRAPKALTLSSRPCDMLCSLSRATVGFSTFTASVLIAFIMSSRGFLDRATPPLLRWIPLRSSGSRPLNSQYLVVTLNISNTISISHYGLPFSQYFNPILTTDTLFLNIFQPCRLLQP